MSFLNKIKSFFKSIFTKKPNKPPVKKPSPANPHNKKNMKIHYRALADRLELSATRPLGRTVTRARLEAMTYICETFIDEGYTDLRLLAYALATCRREVGVNMVPVREGFKRTDKEAREHVRHRAYGKVINNNVYYGRGYVQLTWDYNYKKEGILDNPDMALDPAWAARLIFKGLSDGRWNGKGKGVMYYLSRDDAYQARRTVNVLDHAQEVADYYRDFLSALNTSTTFY